MAYNTPPKPANAVWKRLFAGKATPEDKAQVRAYQAAQRAVKQNALFVVGAAGATVNEIRRPQKAQAPEKPAKAVYRRMFAGEATPEEKRAVQVYNLWKRTGVPPELRAGRPPNAPDEWLHRTVRVVAPGVVFELWFKTMEVPTHRWLIIRVGRKKWIAMIDGTQVLLSAKGHKQSRGMRLDKEDYFKSGPAAVAAATTETNLTLARKAFWAEAYRSGKGE